MNNQSSGRWFEITWYSCDILVIYCRKDINSFHHSAAYTRQWMESKLVQIMACCLFGAKPLTKPMQGYCQLDPLEPTSLEFYQNTQLCKTASENIVCEMSPILSIDCVNGKEHETEKVTEWNVRGDKKKHRNAKLLLIIVFCFINSYPCTVFLFAVTLLWTPHLFFPFHCSVPLLTWTTAKPVCNDHLCNKIYYLWFIQ